MKTNTIPHRIDGSSRETAEQLALLPTGEVSARFRLSKDTRERGLRHVAEIREMLAQRSQQGAPQHGRAA